MMLWLMMARRRSLQESFSLGRGTSFPPPNGGWLWLRMQGPMNPHNTWRGRDGRMYNADQWDDWIGGGFARPAWAQDPRKGGGRGRGRAQQPVTAAAPHPLEARVGPGQAQQPAPGSVGVPHQGAWAGRRFASPSPRHAAAGRGGATPKLRGGKSGTRAAQGSVEWVSEQRAHSIGSASLLPLTQLSLSQS